MQENTQPQTENATFVGNPAHLRKLVSVISLDSLIAALFFHDHIFDEVKMVYHTNLGSDQYGTETRIEGKNVRMQRHYHKIYGLSRVQFGFDLVDADDNYKVIEAQDFDVEADINLDASFFEGSIIMHGHSRSNPDRSLQIALRWNPEQNFF